MRSIRGVEKSRRPKPPRAAAGLGIKLVSVRSGEQRCVPAETERERGRGVCAVRAAGRRSTGETAAGGLGCASLDSGELIYF